MKQLLSLAMLLFICCAPIECSALAPKKEKNRTKIPSEQEIQQQEEQLLKMINEVRRSHDLPDLVYWDALAINALEHSTNMADNKVEFGHGGFDQRAQNVKKMGKYRALGENVAYTYYVRDPLQKSIDMWMKSPGHRKNILGDYTKTGIGIAYSQDGTCYLTQLFSK